MSMFEIFFVLALPLALVVAAGFDVVTFEIPDEFPIWLLALAPALFLTTHLPWPLALAHVGVGILAFLIGASLFYANLMGGGDVKLLAASAVWIGPMGALDFFYYTALAGGVLTLMLILARRFSPVKPTAGLFAKIFSPDFGAPYAVAIAAGGILAWPQTPHIAQILK